ncbi:troponin I, fast skeletal muscle-like [Oncorhynchus masou masou]|uniref:troponin I, fast skeletal muscle-like n=1 Tax=Oncorhynchus masou masou TaxID=90313 RepID=UPI003183D5D9
MPGSLAELRCIGHAWVIGRTAGTLFKVPFVNNLLQELCKTIHHQIDKVDEERYDLAGKGGKCDKEIEDLRIKVIEFQGLSADSMLQALLGSKHKVSMDFRANLKEVKKEVKEEDKDAVGDWRKNIDDKAGMDGRKKMFEAV